MPIITCISQSFTHWPCSRSLTSLCCLQSGKTNFTHGEYNPTRNILKTLHLTSWVARLAVRVSEAAKGGKKKVQFCQSVEKKKEKKTPGNSTLFTGAATWPTAPKSPKQPISVCSQREHCAVSFHPCSALAVDPLKVYQLNALPAAAVQLVFCGE